MSDNPILRPVESCVTEGRARDDFDVSGRGLAPASSRLHGLLSQLSYQFDNRSSAARRKPVLIAESRAKHPTEPRHLPSALLVDKVRTRSFETGIEPETSRVGAGRSTTELRPHMAEAITLNHRPTHCCDGQEASWISSAARCCGIRTRSSSKEDLR